jgi:hypothetical protein
MADTFRTIIMDVDISRFSIVRELVEIGFGIFGKDFGVFDYGSRE